MPRPLKSILVPALCAGTFLGLSGGLARAADVPPHAAASQLVGYDNGDGLGRGWHDVQSAKPAATD